MCFSATASFVTAAATGTAGLATLAMVRQPRELPLAAIPLAFGVQQAVEGALWLSLGGTALAVSQTYLANIFAVFALAFWPIWSPLAIGLVETQTMRRIGMAVLLVVGAGTAAYGLSEIGTMPFQACVVGHSLQYSNGHPYANVALAAYVACTCLPALLSSHRNLWLFGLLIVAGLVVSTVAYFAAFFSVWCFFAAIGSTAIWAHFAARRSVAHIAVR